MHPDTAEYRITERLFTSPNISVARAIRTIDGASVILKSLSTEFPSTTQLSRFNYACEIQKKFQHPNIVRVLDCTGSGNHPVLVLEDNNAISLSEYLIQQPNHQLTIDDFLNISIQLCDALQEIHRQNVIHKDLHLGNIMIQPGPDRIAKITDFGLSSILPREQPSLTPPDQIEGALAYISPEQTGRMNRALDYRTDFYSLGVTFYVLLTGELPFREAGAIAMVHAHIAKLSKPLQSYRKEIPDALAEIVGKLMAKNAEERYQSAVGLKHDLQICRVHWQHKQSIVKFNLAEHDISDSLKIPQKLYGREAEINTLLSAFNETKEGHPVLMTISGYSGIGKSALVHEVHKPIAQFHGVFITGKFDQLQHNIPYSALVQALNQWIHLALTESDAQLQIRKKALIKHLGSNARVLVDLLPEMVLILGELPPIPELGSRETQSRLHHTFVKFIQHITLEQPLVIFIDDLQWADSSTLLLLKLVIEQAEGKLLLLVAYRDNEVSDTHPVIMMLNEIDSAQKQMNISRVTLLPLSIDDLIPLLQDTLNQTSNLSKLASLIHKKTGGNPFFINEFLKTLYKEHLLEFDYENRIWRWDTQHIESKGITDNVVELMLGKMQQLPIDTQQLLQKASCIGSRFDIPTLAIISELPQTEVTKRLWPALKEGLLLQEGGDWFPGMIETQTHDITISNAPDIVPSCRFLHDRMLQAAYSSLGEQERQQTHLTIGELLKQHTPHPEGSQLFAFVEQLNHGRKLISEDNKQIELARFNFRAATLAREASAWKPAFRFINIAKELLPHDSWITNYELTKHIHILLIESSYLVSEFTIADEISNLCLNKLTDNLDKARVCLINLINNVSRETRDLVITRGIQGLYYCGIHIPKSKEMLDDAIQESQNIIDSKFVYKPREQSPSQINEDTPTIKLGLEIIKHLAKASYISGQQHLAKFLIIFGMRLILENHGTLKEQHELVARYLLHVVDSENYELADKLAHSILNAIEEENRTDKWAYISLTIGSGVWFYNHPFKEAIELLKKGFQTGIESGAIFDAVGCFSNIIVYKFSMGLPFAEIQRDLDLLSELMQKYKHRVSGGSHYKKLIDLLTLNSADQSLNRNSFSNFEWKIIKSTSLDSFYHHLKLQGYFWSDKWGEALKIIQTCESKLNLILGLVPNIDHYFISAMIQTHEWDKLNEKEKLSRLELFDVAIEKFEKWAKYCPNNFKHKLLLLQAERTRLLSPTLETVQLFHDAISHAEDNGFLQDNALANERLALLAIQTHLPYISRIAIQQAHYLYGQWGCRIKQKNLELKYPEELISQRAYSLESDHSSSTHSNPKTALDVETIIKASQTISSEIILDLLLAKIMRIILENAGAESGALLLFRNVGLSVEFIAHAENAKTGSGQIALPLEDYNDLPHDLILFVSRTGKNLVIQNVGEDPKWNQDQYIKRRQPRSILCVPIYYRDALKGVLYLENNLAANAFTDERLQVLDLLLAQVSISLENAHLFDEVRRLNSNLEEKVEQRTAELRAVNRELEAFSYSVSHDLRAPLRSIKGFSEALIEDYESSLDNNGIDMLFRVKKSADLMTELIHGLLELSRLTRSNLQIAEVDLAELANNSINDLRAHDPNRQVKFTCAENAIVQGDKRMLYSVVENLINNAWKYSSKKPESFIEFNLTEENGHNVFYVKDNGDGFDMTQSDKLFTCFQRLHSEKQFKGHGVGLATVKRIIERHNGRIWANAERGKGATFFFTLNESKVDT